MQAFILHVQTILQYHLFTLAGYPLTVGELVLVPILIVMGFWLTRKLENILTTRLIKQGVSPDVVHLIKRVVYILAIVMIVITSLDLLEVPITAFAFLTGAIAIGFGFGAQNIINNFISGWILMWERPIRIGDFLEVDTVRGRVEAINTRSTRVRRVDGVHLLIPNSKLLENTVTNWTLMDKLTRSSVAVGVAYGSDVRLVEKLIYDAAKAQTSVLLDPAPKVFFDAFGDSSLQFEVFFWINADAEGDVRSIRSEMRFCIDDLFKQHNIVIAFPQLDVHIDGSIAIAR